MTQYPAKYFRANQKHNLYTLLILQSHIIKGSKHRLELSSSHISWTSQYVVLWKISDKLQRNNVSLKFIHNKINFRIKVYLYIGSTESAHFFFNKDCNWKLPGKNIWFLHPIVLQTDILYLLGHIQIAHYLKTPLYWTVMSVFIQYLQQTQILNILSKHRMIRDYKNTEIYC